VRPVAARHRAARVVVRLVGTRVGDEIADAPQHRVDEPRRLRLARRANEFHRRVDRGVARHAVEEDHLVEPDAQDVAHDRVDRVDGPLAARGDQRVDRPAVAQHALHDLARKVGVARLEVLPGHQPHECVLGARAGVDAAEDFEGEASCHGAASVAEERGVHEKAAGPCCDCTRGTD